MAYRIIDGSFQPAGETLAAPILVNYQKRNVEGGVYYDKDLYVKKSGNVVDLEFRVGVGDGEVKARSIATHDKEGLTNLIDFLTRVRNTLD